MISKASSTNFQSGHIKNFSIPKGSVERTKPLATQGQLLGLSQAYQVLKRGDFEHLGKNFDYEEGLHGACFTPGKSKTGYELVQDQKTGDMAAYKARDLETNEPASILLLRGDKEIKINDDEPIARSYFNTVRATLQDLLGGGK